MSTLSKCLATTETEGKAKLIKKIFSPTKVDAKPKDISTKMESGKVEKEEEVEDEIDLQSLGERGKKKGSLKDENVSRELFRKSDPSDMETNGSVKEKPWRCPFCDKQFSSKNILKLHCQKRHPFKTLDGILFRSGDGGEETEGEKGGNNNVSVLLDTRRYSAEPVVVNTQEDSHVVGVFEEVDHDDEETDPYEDDSGQPFGLTAEMEDKAGSLKDVKEKKWRENDDEDDEEVAVLQKAQALNILTSRVSEDRMKKKELRKILKSKKARRRKKVGAGKEISLKRARKDIDTGEEELPKEGNKKKESLYEISAISNETKEAPNDTQEEREAIAEMTRKTSQVLNEMSNVQAQTLDGKEDLLNTGDTKQDVNAENSEMSLCAQRDRIEELVELRDCEENGCGDKTEKDKLCDIISESVVPESEENGIGETEVGKAAEVSGCLLMMVEASTTVGPTEKERGFATTIATEYDTEQEDAKYAQSNTKPGLEITPGKVASAEPAKGSIAKGVKESNDDEAGVFKECNIRPAAEIDVVSDNER